VLNEYLAKVGGKEAILAAWQEKKATAKKGKKRGRASTGTEATNGTKRGRKNGHPKDGSPPVSASKVEWKPPSGSWEEHVTHVDACEGNEGTVVVYLTWKTGQKTQHPLAAVYKRCPQQMLRFYESHLFVFSSLPLPNLTNTSLGSLRRTMMPSKRPHQKERQIPLPASNPPCQFSFGHSSDSRTFPMIQYQMLHIHIPRTLILFEQYVPPVNSTNSCMALKEGSGYPVLLGQAHRICNLAPEQIKGKRIICEGFCAIYACGCLPIRLANQSASVPLRAERGPAIRTCTLYISPRAQILRIYSQNAPPQEIFIA
jgi:hypothetical protein